MPVLEIATAPLLETGTEPEFFVTNIAKWEVAADGCIRLYLASERGSDHLRLEFTVVVGVARLAKMAKQAQDLAVEIHNLLTWESPTAPN